MTEEFSDEQPQAQLDLGKYWDLVVRRRWYLLLPFFLGWIAVWGASWFLPSVYRSGTLILVEQPSVSKDLVPTSASSDLQDRLDSITQQLRSRTRLLRVIDHFDLYAKQRAHHVSDDALVEKMNKDLDIELVRIPGKDQLSSFNIYFSADNPYTAQQVTGELTNILISENSGGRHPEFGQHHQIPGQPAGRSPESSGLQEERVRQFKDRNLGELPGQLQSNLQILGGLQNQLASEQDALGRAKQQNAYYESLISQYKTVAATQPKAGQPNTVGLPALDQELDGLKAQLADLSSRYTDQHPDVRKLKEEIAETEKMRQQVLADMKAKAADPGNSTPEYASAKDMAPLMEVESQLKGNQIEIANRQRTIADLEGKINQYQARLNGAPVREEELADLTRDYDQSQKDYDSLLARRNQSERGHQPEQEPGGGALQHDRSSEPADQALFAGSFQVEHGWPVRRPRARSRHHRGSGICG